MVAIFGAVAAVGVVGAVAMNTMKGPVRSMHNVTQKTIAENNMIAAGKLALMAAINQPDGGDCDGDGSIEPVPFETNGTGPHPDGGGYLPSAIGAAKLDPWGNEYGYCVWDHGTWIHASGCGTNRLRGQEDEDGLVIAVISSGPDRIFQTSCADAPDYLNRVSGSDDIILAYSYAEAATLSGGLWNIKAGDPDTAEISKDLEVRSSDGDVVFGVDSRTDIDRPAIKVDYINKLSPLRKGTEFLSNIILGDSWLSGDGDDEGIFIDADGNVGIGTAAPFRFGSNSTRTLTIETADASQLGSPSLEFSRATDSLLAGSEIFAIRGMAGASPVQTSAITSNVVGTDEDAGSLNFWTKETGQSIANRMTIQSSGNVGIGTSDPQRPVHILVNNPALLLVERPGNVNAGIQYKNTVTSMFAGLARESVTGWGISMNQNIGSESLFMVRDSGNVGIGTTSPVTRLHVAGTGRFDANLSMNANNITNLATPTANHHAATKAYVDSTVTSTVGAFTETDPSVGTITNGRWCRGSGGRVVCDQDALSGGGFTETTVRTCTTSGGGSMRSCAVSCNAGWSRTGCNAYNVSDGIPYGNPGVQSNGANGCYCGSVNVAATCEVYCAR